MLEHALRDEQIHLIVVNDQNFLPGVRYLQLFCFARGTALATTYDGGCNWCRVVAGHDKHREREAAAHTGFTLDSDVAAHQCGKLPGNRKSETGTTVVAGIRVIDLRKLLEQFRLIFLADADATVLYRNTQPNLVRIETGHLIARTNDADIAIFRKLDRVADQVGDDLAQSYRVAAHHFRHVVRNRIAERQILALRLGRE